MSGRFRHLFVVTHGRSGSTLLMGYLNRLPGFCIRGENNGLLPLLWRSAHRLRNAPTGSDPTDAATHPWYGFEQVDGIGYRRSLAEAFVAHVLRPPRDATTVGFKEVRFPQVQRDFDNYLGFPLDTFPQTGVILLTRSIDEARRSAEKKRWPAESLQVMSTVHERITGSSFRNDPRFHALTFEAMTNGDTAIRALHGFLDVPFDLEQWHAARDLRHSY